MFEHYSKPVISTHHFINRVLFYILFSLVVLIFSLSLGVWGYYYFGNLNVIDSILNASMILTGMGPVNPMITNEGKLFASFYAIFSGIAFLTTQGIVLAPIIHRFLHLFNVESEDD